ncbi:hypothetical protein D3C79_823920 [compost metagenome]
MAATAGHHLIVRVDLHTRALEVDEERRDACGALPWRGHCQQHGKVGIRRTGDITLGAVEHIVVTIKPRTGFDRAGIGTRFGFGQGKAHRLLGPAHRLQELFHLHRACHLEQVTDAWRAAQLAQHMRREHRAGKNRRLLDRTQVNHAEAGAAQVLRQHDVVETQFAGTLPDIGKNRLGMRLPPLQLFFLFQRDDFIADKGLHVSDDAFGFFAWFDHFGSAPARQILR